MIRHLFSRLRTFYRNSADLEDAVQDVLLKTLQAGPLHSPRAYAMRVALRDVVTCWRRRGRAARTLGYGTDLDHIETPVRQPPGDSDQDAVTNLNAMLTALPADLRHVLALRARGLKMREIADDLGCSKHAVRHRWRRAVSILRGILTG
jgi:RNA polymerase sigma factor (sigma-70 family)